MNKLIENQQGNRRLNTINQIDLIDIYRTFYTAKEYTLFSKLLGPDAFQNSENILDFGKVKVHIT